MPDPIEPIGAPEIFSDGVAEIKIIENVARIPFYSRHNGDSLVVLRVNVPVSELPEVIQAMVTALALMVRSVVKPVSH